MNRYNQEIDNSINSNIFRFEEIFNFESTPNEDVFKMFYDFCRDNLDIQSSKLELNPNIFIFYNNFNVNAKAGKVNDNFVIAINSGLVIWCLNNFVNNEKLNEFLDVNFEEIVSKFDNPTSILAMQIATQFTYYHECSHLIQLSKRNESLTLQERAVENSTYNFELHMLEINADSYAAIALASHFQQYIEKSFSNNLDSKEANDCLKILCVCVVEYISSFSDSQEEIYLKEKSHPHPFLRTFNIILNIVHYLNQGSYFKSLFININPNQLLKEIFEFHHQLEDEKIFKSNFKQSFIKGSMLQDEIVNYLGELIEFDSTNYHNALEMWNKHIT